MSNSIPIFPNEFIEYVEQKLPQSSGDHSQANVISVQMRMINSMIENFLGTGIKTSKDVKSSEIPLLLQSLSKLSVCLQIGLEKRDSQLEITGEDSKSPNSTGNISNLTPKQMQNLMIILINYLEDHSLEKNKSSGDIISRKYAKKAPELLFIELSINLSLAQCYNMLISGSKSENLEYVKLRSSYVEKCLVDMENYLANGFVDNKSMNDTKNSGKKYFFLSKIIPYKYWNDLITILFEKLESYTDSDSSLYRWLSRRKLKLLGDLGMDE